jgi:hypothetical protein
VGSSVVPSGEGDATADFIFPDSDTPHGITFPADLKAEIDARDEEKWPRGFAYWPENHSAAIVRDPSDMTTVDDPTTPANLAQRYVQPYLVETKLSAATFGFETIDYIGRAERQLDAAIASAVEKEFWTGTLAQAKGYLNDYLTNITNPANNLTPGSTTISDGTAVSISKGFAILQDAAASAGFGGQAMIHCIPGITPNLLSTRRQGKLLLDQFDNFVVPGVGYTGTGPGGAAAAAGTSWMYVTDLVMTRIQKKARVFPNSMAEAVDRGQDSNPNLVTFRAFKYAVAYFDGFVHYAVKVSLPS